MDTEEFTIRASTLSHQSRSLHLSRENVLRILSKNPDILHREHCKSFTLKPATRGLLQGSFPRLIVKIEGCIIYMYSCFVRTCDERLYRDHKFYRFNILNLKMDDLSMSPKMRREGEEFYFNDVLIHIVQKDVYLDGELQSDVDLKRNYKGRVYTLKSSPASVSILGGRERECYIDVIHHPVPVNYFLVDDEVYFHIGRDEKSHIYHAASMKYVCSLSHVSRDIFSHNRRLYSLSDKGLHVYNITLL